MSTLDGAEPSFDLLYRTSDGKSQSCRSLLDSIDKATIAPSYAFLFQPGGLKKSDAHDVDSSTDAESESSHASEEGDRFVSDEDVPPAFARLSQRKSAKSQARFSSFVGRPLFKAAPSYASRSKRDVDVVDSRHISENTKMNLYEEAMHYLGMAYYIYVYSFQREQSKRGFSRFDFDTFAIESDTMTDYEIIQNVPLKLIPKSMFTGDDGEVSDDLLEELGGITMPTLYIRAMQGLAEYGFPRSASKLFSLMKSKTLVALKIKKLLGGLKNAAKIIEEEENDDDNSLELSPKPSKRISWAQASKSLRNRRFSKVKPEKSVFEIKLKKLKKKAVKKGASKDEVKEEEHPGHKKDMNIHKAIVASKALKELDELVEKGLKYADPDKSKHVGRLDMLLGLHGVQCEFDQVYAKAKQGDPLYAKVKELYERPQTRRGEEDANKITEEDHLLIHKMMKDMHKDTSILRLITNVAHGNERLVWIYDRSRQECVYVIFLNPILKRMTVIFRGTVTLEDIVKNCRFKVFEMKNPIPEDYEGKTEALEMNNGYSEYLFSVRSDNGRTKYDEISDRVYELAEYIWGEDPEFELCVSGHSLGGALASLYAFKASTDPRFMKKENPKAVRVFTYGGAIPGRITFARAFQHQEEEGRLMHLRVVMKYDIVPCLHPPQIYDYAHTGYRMMVETEGFKEEEKKKSGKKKNRKNPTPPKYEYVHDQSWWNTKSANIGTNFLVNFPWKKPSFVPLAHDPRLYLKALIEAKFDGNNAMLSRRRSSGRKAAMRKSSGASNKRSSRKSSISLSELPVDNHNWTLEEHYAQMATERMMAEKRFSRTRLSCS